MNASHGWKYNRHYSHSHTHTYTPTHTHTHACTLTYMHAHGRKHMPTHSSSWWWHMFLSGCKVDVKCMVGNDDMRVWSCVRDEGAPYGSLRPCHYLVTPLTPIQREREREKEKKIEKRGRERIIQDHATSEIVWGQQCHNYFKMSACNKIQQFIWQKAN